MTTKDQIPSIIDDLETLYQTSVRSLRQALSLYLSTGRRPTSVERAGGLFAYPQLRVHYASDGPAPRVARAFALIRKPGQYAVSVTRPELFRRYLTEQLELLVGDYGVSVSTGLSSQEIPYAYVLEDSGEIPFHGAASDDLARIFPSTDLSHIGDEVVDGIGSPHQGDAHPLALFDAPRVDYSLARLRHYTGTPVDHVQDYVLFTNYTRYVDEFVRWGCSQLKEVGGRYSALSLAGNVSITKDTADPERWIAESAWRKHQMPAYHLIGGRGGGVTLINIGVGPSNAKTITDHLAF